MSLKSKAYFMIIFPAVLMASLLSVRGVHFVATFFISVIGAVVVYFCWLFMKERRLNNILDRDCDPVRYLEKCNKANMVQPDFNKAIAYLCLGDFDRAIGYLQNVELPKKVSKPLELVYHCAFMVYYLETGDLENVKRIYEENIKELRKSILHPAITFSVDLQVLAYQYKVNMTDDTAKYYLEQLGYLYEVNSKKISMRQKVATRFIEAGLLEGLGDMDGAMKKYNTVAKYGNRLYIAKLAREKLAERAD
ncbi:MAG: hypothetical protein FWB71_00050 [Defluviitaleaceae bacterium]|nr:hypothetical protein [Defluviitaleaceae bacterium]